MDAKAKAEKMWPAHHHGSSYTPPAKEQQVVRSFHTATTPAGHTEKSTKVGESQEPKKAVDCKY